MGIDVGDNAIPIAIVQDDMNIINPSEQILILMHGAGYIYFILFAYVFSLQLSEMYARAIPLHSCFCMELLCVSIEVFIHSIKISTWSTIE